MNSVEMGLEILEFASKKDTYIARSSRKVLEKDRKSTAKSKIGSWGLIGKLNRRGFKDREAGVRRLEKQRHKGTAKELARSATIGPRGLSPLSLAINPKRFQEHKRK